MARAHLSKFIFVPFWNEVTYQIFRVEQFAWSSARPWLPDEALPTAPLVMRTSKSPSVSIQKRDLEQWMHHYDGKHSA